MLSRIKEVSEAALISARLRAGSYSQLGEDLILKYIADQIGLKGGIMIDIGASDGQSMSNSYLLRTYYGFGTYAYDGAYENDLVHKKLVTPAWIQSELEPGDTALHHEDVIHILSLDIDGQDYWVLKKLIEYKTPNIICLEVNGCIQQDTPVAVALDDNFKWDRTDYYGANLIAYKNLLSDYTLVFHHHSQNAFFVHKSFNCPEFTEPMERVQSVHHDSKKREWVNL